MHDEPIMALVLAQPGPLRDGLAALLSAIPAIDAVHITGDLAEGIALVTAVGNAVIVADVSCMSEEGVRSSLEEFRRASPAALIVLLVNTGSADVRFERPGRESTSEASLSAVR